MSGSQLTFQLAFVIFLANCSLFYPNAREFEDDVHPMLYIENGFEKNATIHMFVSPYRELVNRII